MQSHTITMLGTGLIGDFYTATLHSQRSRDRVGVVYSRSEERGQAFAQRWDIPVHTMSVTLRASSERRKTAESAMSPGWRKPADNGCFVSENSRIPGCSWARSDIGVATRPGAITFTRIP